MKKLFIYIIPNLTLVFLLFVKNIYADEIHLRSGITVNGTILRVTSDYIEYDPEGNRPFDMISRDLVAEIVYEDGSVINFDKSKHYEKNKGKTIVEADELNEQDVVVEMDRNTEIKKNKDTGSARNKYIEFEFGWNGYVGLGARFDFRLFSSFSLNGGLGLGLWGYRLSAGARYFIFDYPFGPAVGLGIAYNTGRKDIELDAEIKDNTGNTYEEELIFEFKPVAVVNITFLYGFKVGSRNKIYVEAGYGIRLSDDNYNYRRKDSSEAVVLDKETKDSMDLIQPGGVILSVGFALAI